LYFNFKFINFCLSFSGDLLKLLDVSSAENILPTTYGSLQPPLGKHRLKVCGD
jgi:serine/threonine-protein phosphatase 6 regulatory subunit 3